MVANTPEVTIIASMEEPSRESLLSFASRLARESARLTRHSTGTESTALKADGSVVTETDLAIQTHIVGAIATAYPDHAVIAEEAGTGASNRVSPTSARYCWVIDPLDGTRNFVSGFPGYATSIAVLDRGRPVAAAVSDHNLGDVYTAAAGRGAARDDRPMPLAMPDRASDLLIGVPSSMDRLTQNVLRAWVGTRGFILRNVGSTALHLAWVASGALSGAYCRQCKIWDIAAGALMITESGGRISDPFGGDRIPFSLNGDPNEDLPTLAARPGVHERLLRSIKNAKS